MSDPVRERILAEATRLFGDQGYGRTSVRELARAAQVSNPAIYYHFGSKEGLYLEALRHQARASMAASRAILEGPGSLRERLTRIMEDQLERAREDPSALRLLMYANHRPAGDEPQVDMLSLHQEGAQLLLALLREAIDTGELRADLDPMDAYVMLRGVCTITGWAAMNGRPLPEDVAERMIDLLYRGAQEEIR